MLPLIFILVDAAAGVHTGVTSLITTLVILTLDSVSLSVFDFFLSIQSHQQTGCVGPFTGWSTQDI